MADSRRESDLFQRASTAKDITEPCHLAERWWSRALKCWISIRRRCLTVQVLEQKCGEWLDDAVTAASRLSKTRSTCRCWTDHGLAHVSTDGSACPARGCRNRLRSRICWPTLAEQHTTDRTSAASARLTFAFEAVTAKNKSAKRLPQRTQFGHHPRFSMRAMVPPVVGMIPARTVTSLLICRDPFFVPRPALSYHGDESTVCSSRPPPSPILRRLVPIGKRTVGTCGALPRRRKHKIWPTEAEPRGMSHAAIK